MSSRDGYSSQTYSPSGNKPISSSTNKELLTPIDRTVDPEDQAAKSIEKDQMVGLNDKFVAFINKVKNREEKNQTLQKRLEILKNQEVYKAKVDELVQQQKIDLQQQIDGLTRDKQKQEQDLARCKDDVNQTRLKLEEEGKKKMDLENEFVINKKVADEGYLGAVDLALELEKLMGELDFLKQGHEEEMKELESQIQNETVTVREPNNRALNMDEIIETTKNQYAEMAARAREDAERWNQKKIDDMVQTAGKQEKDARDVKKEISDMLRLIHRLKGDLEALKKQKEGLEEEIEQADGDGQMELEHARVNISDVEAALLRAKQDMAGQVKEYQKLMNHKLALEIEIATCQKLLEGEELRMDERQSQRSKISSVFPNTDTLSKLALTSKPAPTKRLLIKIEVKEGKMVSKSVHYSDD